MRVNIEIYLKDGILDPQAKTIFHALESIGFDCINSLGISKIIKLDINTNDKNIALQKAEEMAKNLLANVVIENYKIELEP
ncbi:phosphoribosylformylglycinamidine synthase subunit PurS [Helicobacter sp. MIT 14-3879]|uniref:phosphoribosylformylglycinamidine synthase subunit PurS n=1 Tax=Helicobacter sp. MIT 14-3879 TaxID=2040649 RepID=UPI000E1F1B7F|nr:phosphoribosylformylglycinamidine synthase subunit PurS [Helicobacter sp. MIT 14-3879]RDU62091.1 phosphoribosylformylglycinamidine synthase [Helicobacter sp. MIT 14-3879]